MTLRGALLLLTIMAATSLGGSASGPPAPTPAHAMRAGSPDCTWGQFKCCYTGDCSVPQCCPRRAAL
jgi:hypothetical protein